MYISVTRNKNNVQYNNCYFYFLTLLKIYVKKL